MGYGALWVTATRCDIRSILTLAGSSGSIVGTDGDMYVGVSGQQEIGNTWVLGVVDAATSILQ